MNNSQYNYLLKVRVIFFNYKFTPIMFMNMSQQASSQVRKWLVLRKRLTKEAMLLSTSFHAKSASEFMFLPFMVKTTEA